MWARNTTIPGSVCIGVTLSLHRSLCEPLPRRPETEAYLWNLKVQEIGQSFIMGMENIVSVKFQNHAVAVLFFNILTF
jgi:hypothetical protein